MDINALLSILGTGVGTGVIVGGVIGLAFVACSGSRSEEHQESGLGGLIWCVFVLGTVVGSAVVFNFPHGGDGGRLDGRAGFGGTILGDPLGLRRNGEGRR